MFSIIFSFAAIFPAFAFVGFTNVTVSALTGPFVATSTTSSNAASILATAVVSWLTLAKSRILASALRMDSITVGEISCELDSARPWNTAL